MKLGISALLYNLEYALEICDKFYEISHIEIGIDSIEDCIELYKHKDTISKLGLSIGIHLPMELNPCEDVKFIRNSWLNFIYKVNNNLKELDIKYFNFHLGYIITNRLLKNRNKYLNNSIDFLNKINLENDVTISVENTYSKGGDISNVGNKACDFNYIFKNLNNSNICFCYDTGHYLINQDDYIDTLKDEISIIHLSDNDGINDSHIGIGYGILKKEHIKEVLNLMPKYLILEMNYEYIENTINKLNFIKEEV